MGWQFWKREPSAAERTMERLRQEALAAGEDWDAETQVDPSDRRFDPHAEPDGHAKPSWPELRVTVLAAPTSTEPGTPLEVVNEGEPLRVGTAVQVVGTFATQHGEVVSITRDGAPVDLLRRDEDGSVVLDDEVDLSQVFRGTELLHPDDEAAQSEALFEVGVLRAEPRGADALVVGRRRSGEPEAGMIVQGTYGAGETPWVAELLAVEVVDGDAGLLLGDVAAHRFLRGDVVFALTRRHQR